MREWFNPEWQSSLSAQGLNQFDAIWALELDWFEEPNQRRGGWSGVARLPLGNGDVFVKRQENHSRKSLMHPFRGIATYECEFDNIRRYQHKSIPTLEPVYFATRIKGGRSQAILITAALDAYVSLDQLLPNIFNALSSLHQRQLLTLIAGVLASMHKSHIVHRSFYPKHIFVGKDFTCGAVDPVRIIDLESSRKVLFTRHASIRDLDSLNRHVEQLGIFPRARFLFAYLEAMNANTRKRRHQLWMQLCERMKAKPAKNTT